MSSERPSGMPAECAQARTVRTSSTARGRRNGRLPATKHGPARESSVTSAHVAIDQVLEPTGETLPGPWIVCTAITVTSAPSEGAGRLKGPPGAFCDSQQQLRRITTLDESRNWLIHPAWCSTSLSHQRDACRAIGDPADQAAGTRVGLPACAEEVDGKIEAISSSDGIFADHNPWVLKNCGHFSQRWRTRGSVLGLTCGRRAADLRRDGVIPRVAAHSTSDSREVTASRRP